MTTLLGKISAMLGGLTLLLAAYLGGVADTKELALGGAANGLASTIASSSVLTVGPEQVITLWSTSNSNGSCASRIVSTTGNAVMLSFGDRPNYPSGNRATTTVGVLQGLLQPASTTVTYDGGLYGCGTVAAYGLVASSTVTLVEFK